MYALEKAEPKKDFALVLVSHMTLLVTKPMHLHMHTCKYTHTHTGPHTRAQTLRHESHRPTEQKRSECLGAIISFHLEFSAIVFLIKISKELSVFTISPPKAIFTLLII